MSVPGRMDYIDPIRDNYPLDFSMLEKALNAGLDINIYDDYSDSKDNQETMLSDALLCYGYKEDEGRKECPYIVDIVRFFLEQGYDPHANEEYNGIHALFALAYSTQCDKYSIEAIKLLLQAGANTEKNVYEDEDYTSIHWIVINHDGDNRGICDYEYSRIENYFRPIIRCIIIFDKGLKLIISEDYLEGPRPNKFFMYLEKG